MMNPLPSVRKFFIYHNGDSYRKRNTLLCIQAKDMNQRNSQQNKKDWNHVCYRLNCYPPYWKFKKRFGTRADQGGSNQMQGTVANDRQQQRMANQVRHELTPSIETSVLHDSVLFFNINSPTTSSCFLYSKN